MPQLGHQRCHRCWCRCRCCAIKALHAPWIHPAHPALICHGPSHFLHVQEIQSFEGFYAPVEKQLVFYVLGLLSGGLLFLLAKWSPKVHIALSLRRCRLKDATFVRITVSAYGRRLPVAVVSTHNRHWKYIQGLNFEHPACGFAMKLCMLVSYHVVLAVHAPCSLHDVACLTLGHLAMH